MSRVPRVIVDPKDPLSIVEHLGRVQRVVDGQLEFGSPQDPRDPTSATRADGVAHNGTILNLAGSWFTTQITAVGRTDVTCVHNLDTPTTAGLLPVRWLIWGWSHSGAGGGAATAVSLTVGYLAGGVTANNIVLAVQVAVVAGALTINGGNPITLDLFFTKAVR